VECLVWAGHVNRIKGRWLGRAEEGREHAVQWNMGIGDVSPGLGAGCGRRERNSVNEKMSRAAVRAQTAVT